nr:thyroid transcription factor 1-associated protein 26 homolog [Helicoverpa armigera]
METKRDSFFMKMKRDNGKPVKQNHEEVGESKFKRQEEFNKNRKGLEVKNEKKPFDKKGYRLKKYSKKYKLKQWEEQRKKRLLREYHKDIKNDPTLGTYKAKTFDEDTTDANQEVGKYVRHPDLVEKTEINNSVKETSLTEKETSGFVKAKKDPYHKAKAHFDKVKQEKLQKQQEKQKIQEEKKQKLDEYKKKKNERFKKLSKKTKKGQPVMTGRLELLLEKIQKSK